jgi:GxxExxY protein
MTENEISGLVIGCAIEVHRELGPGLLESAYEVCMMHELKREGLSVSQQVPLQIVYKGVRLEAGYRLDIVVENSVILELKSVDFLADIHTAQLLTYLKLKNLKLGLLINFNTLLIRNGIKRVVNNL